MFHQLLDWRLLVGSHKFPGADGGTCITEAAVVVAGLRYREISDPADCPPCFSLPIAIYAIGLNDSMPDDLRQELLIPFVTQLAGTADTPEIERQRADLLATRCVSDLLPIVLRFCGLASHAVLCESASTCEQAHAAAKAVQYADTRFVYDAHLRAASTAATSGLHDATYPDRRKRGFASFAKGARSAALCADACASAVRVAASCPLKRRAVQRRVWTSAVAILDSALRIGNQAEPVEVATIVARAEAEKRKFNVPC